MKKKKTITISAQTLLAVITESDADPHHIKDLVHSVIYAYEDRLEVLDNEGRSKEVDDLALKLEDVGDMLSDLFGYSDEADLAWDVAYAYL